MCSANNEKDRKNADDHKEKLKSWVETVLSSLTKKPNSEDIEEYRDDMFYLSFDKARNEVVMGLDVINEGYIKEGKNWDWSWKNYNGIRPEHYGNYTKGHVVPAGNHECFEETCKNTYTLMNIVPEVPDLVPLDKVEKWMRKRTKEHEYVRTIHTVSYDHDKTNCSSAGKCLPIGEHCGDAHGHSSKGIKCLPILQFFIKVVCLEGWKPTRKGMPKFVYLLFLIPNKWNKDEVATKRKLISVWKYLCTKDDLKKHSGLVLKLPECFEVKLDVDGHKKPVDLLCLVKDQMEPENLPENVIVIPKTPSSSKRKGSTFNPGSAKAPHLQEKTSENDVKATSK